MISELRSRHASCAASTAWRPANPGATNAEHKREKLAGEKEFIVGDAVLRHEKPAVFEPVTIPDVLITAVWFAVSSGIHRLGLD